MIQDVYVTNRHNLEVKRDLQRQRLEAEKFENERNAFISKQLESKRQFEEQKKREKIDEIAYLNQNMASDLKRRELEREYEEKRRRINDQKYLDPFVLNGQQHFEKVRGSKLAQVDAYRQLSQEVANGQKSLVQGLEAQKRQIAESEVRHW